MLSTTDAIDHEEACVSGYQIAHLDDIDEISDGRAAFRPVRHHLGLTSFGINTFTGHEAGDRLINEHDETDDGNEEVYFVASGRARFELDGENVDAPTGTFVSVEPSVKRTAFAEEPGTTLVAVGGIPGKAYEPRGWEVWAPLTPLYAAGNYAEVAERARPLVDEYPQFPIIAYNLACCESLLGQKDEAIGHLRGAIEKFEGFREYAKGDSDFDAIREEPEFKELVGA